MNNFTNNSVAFCKIIVKWELTTGYFSVTVTNSLQVIELYLSLVMLLLFSK